MSTRSDPAFSVPVSVPPSTATGAAAAAGATRSKKTES
eukprot:CAMPEP_0185840194 /NCGR_PEP_ID=MMETSP1353-20130828/15830_1 /TAXON_ID=1077150 /ORGANISM="Erythrolobus australicus, Strain CCMP3124" /LENGTH=37 /DNA_ID= /DNA_START= /DNA_END= /DNA_ORIENTATION=